MDYAQFVFTAGETAEPHDAIDFATSDDDDDDEEPESASGAPTTSTADGLGDFVHTKLETPEPVSPPPRWPPFLGGCVSEAFIEL